MSLSILLGLILCNLVWSANPAMGKLLLQEFAPSQVAWIRYAGALLVYIVLFVPLARKWVRGPAFLLPTRSSRLTPRDLLWLLLLAFLTFCYSPLLQITGLAASRAVDNALIVAMEPLMTVFLAAIVLREQLRWDQSLAFAVSLIGFFLLSGMSWERLLTSWDGHLLGNFVILLSLLGEASYSVLGRKLLGRYQAHSIFGSALLFGVGFLTLALFLQSGLPSFDPRADHWNARTLLGALWLGPLGTTATYLYWMIALTRAPVASLALTLFIQPVMGAVWGVLFLDERLNALQAVGGSLILAAVVAPSFFSSKNKAVA